MNELFLVFLSLSLSGSVLALLLFALGSLTKRRLSKSWQYYIWLVVLLRFLVPIAPQPGVVGELARSLQGVAAAQSGELQQAGPEAGGGTAAGDGRGAAAPSDRPEPGVETEHFPPAAPAAGGRSNILSHAWIVWLGVALVLIAYKAATYRSFARFAKAGAVSIPPGRLRDLYLDELAIGNIRGQPPLYTNDLISSPMLVGVVRPAVILPPLDVGEQELRHILRHELVHYRRLDSLYKWLAQLVLCLHWFNPLVYLVARQLGKACELACDEAVVKRLDAKGRIGYGDALIASLKTQGRYSSSVISITMSEDASAIRERLDSIAGYRGRTARARIASAALTILLLCGFAFTGAYQAAGRVDGGSPAGTSAGADGASGANGGRRGIGQAPGNADTVTARSGGSIDHGAAVEIVIRDDAAVRLEPTTEEDISVDYGDSLYAVSMEQKNGDWRIQVAYTGGEAVYPAATLRLPDVVYGKVDVFAEQATVYFDGVFGRGGQVNAHLEDCSVFYTVPAGFAGTLDAVAPGSYLQLHSEDGYRNCAVTIANCATFGSIAEGFAKRGDSLVYSHGTAAGSLRIDMAGDGYAAIEPGPYIPPAASSHTAGPALVEREYTLDQLREQNIWGVKVVAAEEDVRVTTGGQTLKLHYHQESRDDYTLETVSDRGGTIRELYLLRNGLPAPGEPQRTIHITIPDGFACDVLHISTAGGGISLDDCRVNTVLLQTQNGSIGVNGGAVEGYFSAASADGGIHITGAALPSGQFTNNLQTESGTVRLRLPMPVSEYAFKLDAGSEANLRIGGEGYSGGSAYTVNSGGSAGTITFTSERGSLIVEDA